MKLKEINGVKIVNDEVEALSHILDGNQVARFEYGDSMSPILDNGEYAVLTPIQDYNDIQIGDAVFCEVNGVLMTHMVWLISDSSYGVKLFLIGSSQGNLYGWTNLVYAKAKGTKIFEK